MSLEVLLKWKEFCADKSVDDIYDMSIDFIAELSRGEIVELLNYSLESLRKAWR